MHISFPAVHRAVGLSSDSASSGEAGEIFIVRDPDDESEWQYLGNPEIAARTSLSEVVSRFLHDCAGDGGRIDPRCRPVARQVRDALVLAARQIDEALAEPR